MDLATIKESLFTKLKTFQNFHGKGQIRSNKGGNSQGQSGQMEDDEEEESSSSSPAISPIALHSEIGTQGHLEIEVMGTL